MNVIEITLWWVCTGFAAISSSICLMALIGCIKRREEINFFKFLINCKNGFKEAAQDMVREHGVSSVFADFLVSSLLWPISVYFVLTGKYSWN
jgi:hypothetical protein